MIYEVQLPDMGEDAEGEASIAYWFKEEGDRVVEGEDLVELTTDKAAFTLPSPRSGVLLEKLVEEGDDVTVGDVVCTIET